MAYSGIGYSCRFIGVFFFMLGLSACGGGGGSGDLNDGFVPGPAPQGATIDVLLTDADGNALSEITPLQAGLFRVSVSSPDGNPVGKEVVSGDITLGRLQPENGTALTDDNGIATFIVQPAGLDGAGTLTATATYDGVESSGSLNYSVSTQLPFTLNGEFLDADQTEIGRAVTGNRISLIVTLVDSRLDLPVKNQLISADIGGLGSINPASATAVTLSLIHI